MRRKRRMLAALLMIMTVLLTACMGKNAGTDQSPETTEAPRQEGFILPDDIRVDSAGVPQLRVYVTDEKEIHEMDAEEYLCGVLAGEMKNDWPEEALKAQAILARTFVIKFISEKQSKYSGADISTDIEEAQAYDFEGINDRIREAVENTRGQIVCYQGNPIYAWFHAHSGGRTATAAEGLSYKEEAPYTESVESVESQQAPEDDAEWEVEFTEQQVIAAAADVGVKLGDSVKSVSAGAQGESGRLKTLKVNNSEIAANEFRIAIGSTDMKSTWITDVRYEDGMLRLRGKGYGHGVGMSQWGAYELAEEGKNANEIINMYFRDVDIVQIWN